VSALRLALAAAAVLRARASVAWWTLVARARLRAHGAAVGRGLRVRGPIRLHCHRTGTIRIGDHCRIQSGFAGNAVGAGAVVGAGSVVRGEVPPGQVWAGNPARFVRELSLALPRPPAWRAFPAEAAR